MLVKNKQKHFVKIKNLFKIVFLWFADKFDKIFDFAKKKLEKFFKWIRGKYEKHNKLFKRTYWCAGWFLWICLACSVIIEFINGGSIIHTIFNSSVAVPQFLNLEAIGKVCETIGISSILIVWLYSSFSKEEIGLKYIEILRFEHKYYWAYTLSHILSILAAIWASKTNALEIGLLALLIVIWGCAMHGVFIFKLLFNPASKKRISKAVWEYRIDNPEDETDYFQHIYTLTDIVDVRENFNLNDTAYLIADAMLKLPSKYGKSLDDNLYFYQVIWKNLLEKHNNEKRIIITKLMFIKISEREGFEEAKTNICAGYILWLYDDILNKQNGKTKEKDTLSNIMMHLEILSSQTKNEFIQQCLFAFFYCLMWLVFFNKKISLNNYLLEKSNDFKFDVLQIYKMRNYVVALSKNLEYDNKDAINISLEQIYKF